MKVLVNKKAYTWEKIHAYYKKYTQEYNINHKKKRITKKNLQPSKSSTKSIQSDLWISEQYGNAELKGESWFHYLMDEKKITCGGYDGACPSNHGRAEQPDENNVEGGGDTDG